MIPATALAYIKALEAAMPKKPTPYRKPTSGHKTKLPNARMNKDGELDIDPPKHKTLNDRYRSRNRVAVKRGPRV